MRDHAPTNPRPLYLAGALAACAWCAAALAGWLAFWSLFFTQLERTL